MKIYEKPSVELIDFQTEAVMSELGDFSLEAYLGYSEMSSFAI